MTLSETLDQYELNSIEDYATVVAEFILNETLTKAEQDAKKEEMKKAAWGGGVGAALAGPAGAGLGGRITSKGSGKWAFGGSLAGALAGGALGGKSFSGQKIGASLGNVAGGAAGGAYGAHRTYLKKKATAEKTK